MQSYNATFSAVFQTGALKKGYGNFFLRTQNYCKKTRVEANNTKHIANSSFLEKLEVRCELSIGPRKLFSRLSYIAGTGLGRFHSLEIIPVQTH